MVLNLEWCVCSEGCEDVECLVGYDFLFKVDRMVDVDILLDVIVFGVFEDDDVVVVKGFVDFGGFCFYELKVEVKRKVMVLLKY